MPLRSVEAATRDDAIAAAREQFGPEARVVGVRRVRSGGVLGFFATERYVAEVAPDRPPGQVSRRDDDLGASPLASASPASAARAGRARSAAPSRNGAAAYAGVARPAEPALAARPAGVPRPATGAASRSLAWTADGPAVDDVRVDELAGLLGGAEPVPSPAPGTYARTAAAHEAPVRKTRWTESLDDQVPARPDVDPPSSSTPSPFTAALARMVAGDPHVRQAVDVAIEEAEDRAAAVKPRDDDRGSVRSTPVRSANTAVWPRAARREEETVGYQVIAPSMPEVRPLEVPARTAAPEVVTAADPAREEAIAEVLRSALAQGHSDEALAGILREVLDGEILDGVAPQTAPTRTVPAPAEPAVAAEPVDGPVVPQQVALVEPVRTPESAPVVRAPAPLYTPLPAFQPFATSTPLPAVDIWGTPPVPPLWGEAAPEPVAEAADEADPVDRVEPSAPPEAAVGAEAATAELVEESVLQDVVEEDVVEEDVVEEDVVEEDAVEEDAVEEDAVEEVAPLLARTASDPAPVALPMTMSLDATSVMPPLSLLPPLPSSRGRGRPPVPPATSRRSVAPATPAAEAARTPAVEEARVAPPEPGPATESLATVTRLPVAPLIAGPGMSEPTEEGTDLLVEVQLLENPAAGAEEPEVAAAASTPAQRTVELFAEPAFTSASESAPEPAASEVSDGIVGRLADLGVPARLLGTDFAGDVGRFGLYAALTRALGLRLPSAPELPLGAGEVLFVVGPGVETLRAARRLSASLCLDPDRVLWATCGDLAGLAPAAGRVTTVDGAMARRQDATQAGTVTIVAVDVPMRADAYWMRQMLAIWSPVAVWAVVEATRKPEDVQPWLESMARVDALIVQDTDLSADPAAVLHRVAAPVAVLDGVRATPHRWASLLCERLEGTEA